jgi:hypothetical protein
LSTKKKPAKKRAKKKATLPIDSFRILAQVRDTPEVNEILKSAEAKLYLKGIDRANGKLQAMIARELQLRRHPGHAGTT